MENKWMARAIILLLVCLTRSLAKGNTTAGNASEEPRNPAKTDFSTKTFQIGRNVTLQCTSRTWNETIYVLWNITIGRKSCRITTAHNGPNTDTCNDGKALHNTSKGESYLFIPNFSKEDEGMYACETALYEKESHRENIKVSSWAVPELSMELKDGQVVCRAVGDKHVESINWKTSWNSSVYDTTSGSDGGLHIMESWFSLPRDGHTDNLTCLALHSLWTGQIALSPTTTEPQTWLIPTVVGCCVLLAMALLLLTYLICKHLSRASVFGKLCCKMNKTQTQATPASNKPPQNQDVEDVEPYASYVQRVNSIYNSSAELFNT